MKGGAFKLQCGPSLLGRFFSGVCGCEKVRSDCRFAGCQFAGAPPPDPQHPVGLNLRHVGRISGLLAVATATSGSACFKAPLRAPYGPRITAPTWPGTPDRLSLRGAIDAKCRAALSMNWSWKIGGNRCPPVLCQPARCTLSGRSPGRPGPCSCYGQQTVSPNPCRSQVMPRPPSRAALESVRAPGRWCAIPAAPPISRDSATVRRTPMQGGKFISPSTGEFGQPPAVPF